MALPDGVAPYVTSARRYLWLAEADRRRAREYGPADAFRARRLDQPGTTLPATFPSRALLLAAGVLAVEEVLGAGPDELRTYGLAARPAEALIFWLERYTMTTFANGPRVGQFYDADDVELLASAARTASTTSDVYEVGDKGTLRLLLALTAMTGTAPVLHVQVETREAYGSGTWRVVDAFGPLVATGSVYRSMSGLDRFVRAVVTIAGTTPVITFSLSGAAA